MANEISIGPNNIPRFPCFSCKALISPTASNCRFCGAPVDYKAARGAADQQARQSQASHRTRALRILSGALVLLLLIGFVVWRGPRTALALLTMFPVLLTIWWIRAGNLSTVNRGPGKTRGLTLLALAVWGAVGPV